MGKCIFCGEEAGFLKSKYKECAESAKMAADQIERNFANFEPTKDSVNDLVAQTERQRNEGRLSIDQFRLLVDRGITKIADQFLADGVINDSEELAISTLLNLWSEATSPHARGAVAQRVVKALTLGDLVQGIAPSRYGNDGLQIVFRKGEDVVWAFHNVKYHVYKKNRQFVSGNRGVSVRVAKGVYFRAGASKGRSIVTDDLTHEDTGLFVITNQALHFKGNLASFRLPLEKIQSVEPFADSIEISDMKQTSKPFYFGVDDPIFASNIIMNLIGFHHE